MGTRLSGRAAGVHLNALGQRQVEELTARLRHIQIDAVVSSPLERAYETAAAIAALRSLDVHTVEEFGEFDFGEWTGRTIQTLDHGDEGWRRFNAVRSLHRPPGGELMLDVQRRAVRALLDVCERFADKIVVVVSHGDVIRSLLLYLLGMPLDFVHRLELSPARVSVVQVDRDNPRVLQVNGDTATVVP